MNDFFDNLDQRQVLALSGDFLPVCDPSQRVQNLASLVMTICEEGRRVNCNPDTLAYFPEWAPVNCILDTMSGDLGLGPRQDNPEMTLRLSIVKFIRPARLGFSAADPRNDFYCNEDFVLDSTDTCKKARTAIAEKTSKFFEGLSKWTLDQETGFWVPPTPEGGEQVAGSA